MVLFRKKKASADAAPGPVLTIVEGSAASGDEPGKTFALHRGDNVIGRDPLCEVVLREATVSRRHANLKVGYGRKNFTIQDLGSANGVLVLPDTRLKNQSLELAGGARFRVGGILLSLVAGGRDEVNETLHVSDLKPIR